MRDVGEQRNVARIALQTSAGEGFALAGSGAVREHGLMSRASGDVDLFTPRSDVRGFDAAVDESAAALRSHGYVVEEVRRFPLFATLDVTAASGQTVKVDFGTDWRAADPVTTDIGPVLGLDDAVGSKMSALYSRAEGKDFVDVDAIRRSGRFTDAQLVALARERDPGFEVPMFAEQLDAVRGVRPREIAALDVDAASWASLQDRCTAWARELRDGPATVDDRDGSPERRRASYPLPPQAALGPPVRGDSAVDRARTRAPALRGYGAER